MKTINAIIVDDELHARESLSSLLEIYCPSINILAMTNNLSEAKLAIETLKPDLLFLDIEIGEDNGFDLVETLYQIDFQIIFTTAFSEFALKAFQVNAVDYLLKPIDPSLLKSAILKVKKRNSTNQMQRQLTNLVESMESKKIKKIAISSLEGISFIEVEKIVHVVGSGNYSTFHLLNNHKVTCSKSLKHFEKILPKNIFFRCHQSHLINLDFVQRVKSSDSVIELTDQYQAPLSKSKKEQLMKIMKRSYGMSG